jgi:hypothetical protein
MLQGRDAKCCVEDCRGHVDNQSSCIETRGSHEARGQCVEGFHLIPLWHRIVIPIKRREDDKAQEDETRRAIGIWSGRVDRPRRVSARWRSILR